MIPRKQSTVLRSNLMRLYFPVDLTGNLIMIEKLILGGIWTGGLPIFIPDALTSAPSIQAVNEDRATSFKHFRKKLS